MAEPLFFLESLPETGVTATLAGEEAHHAIAARRLKAGDTLWLFDGRGTLARATLIEIAARRRELALRVEERRTEPPAKPSIRLACAPPKGDRAAVLLDMATQLGMARFTPLACEHSVVQPGANAATRWRRVCLEACKQSRRLHLPTIEESAVPAEVARRARAAGDSVWLAHPSPQAATFEARGEALTILIGPESGFTEAEVRACVEAGAKVFTLGAAILRIETAAVAALAVVALRSC